MGSNKDDILTSTRISTKIFEDFKIMSIRTKFSIQKLTERSMFLYLTNEEFRKQLHNQLNTYYTGSI